MSHTYHKKSTLLQAYTNHYHWLKGGDEPKEEEVQDYLLDTHPDWFSRA